ncbi:vam6/Vps39-like protein [Tachypleus tridentatus]|uniref:vam6/Vps39-like protein n=1 Tax=Tachypleus tridentatus TaxID=6853 RepID=UPI003FD52599
MHDAYEMLPILEKLPLQIEALAAYDEFLLVGTKQGHLLTYKVTSVTSSNSSNKFEVNLLRSNKSFAKKPVTQIAVVPELNILISLSDNIISVHDLMQENASHISTIGRTKGATLFCLDVRNQSTLTGEVQTMVRICVAVKRKLQLYYWKNRDFHELRGDLCVPDTPKAMVWCQESLCLGFKSEYTLLKISGDQHEIFPTGRNQEPLIALLQDNKLALGRDDQTLFLDSEAKPILKFPLPWSEVPVCLAHDPPYLIGVLPSIIEIRTIETRQLVQEFPLKNSAKAKLVSVSKRGHIYIATCCDVWTLLVVSPQLQIPMLLKQKQFELALKLAGMTNDKEEEKQQCVQYIQNLYAFDLFCNREFKESMDIFLELGTDPSHVIGLFPDLLPEYFRSTLEYPSALPELRGNDLENGLFALTEYLLQVRRLLVGDKYFPNIGIIQGSKTIRSKRQLHQIIDTTLLKCYLETNDALVASLLRLNDNHCHVEESERALKKSHKYSELIILYERKGLHKKALELLMRQARKPDSPLKGHERTIQYLQHLGAEHLELIFEFASWVLKESPENGLKIFTEDLPETEGLPRKEVLEYLTRTNPFVIVPYLEHIIHVWKEEQEVFHNKLIHYYQEKVGVLLKDYLRSLPEGQLPALAGSEPGELGEIRTKLLKFLETSTKYTVESFPSILLNYGLFDEAAVIMEKLGRHEEALAIYFHILQNPPKAEVYCIKNYSTDKPGSQDVFLLLLKMYLGVAKGGISTILSGSHFSSHTPQKPDIKAALNILNNHATKIDPLKALTVLPSSIYLSQLHKFFERILDEQLAKCHSAELMKSLLLAEHLQVQEQRIQCHSHKIVIGEFDICRVCQKRIGKSAFARFPDGVIVHYSCKVKYENVD